MEDVDVRTIIRETIREVLESEHRFEPAYKAELQEERKLRQRLERRINELVEQNHHWLKAYWDMFYDAHRSEFQAAGARLLDNGDLAAYHAVVDPLMQKFRQCKSIT
jgi:hypothetical protein